MACCYCICRLIATSLCTSASFCLLTTGWLYSCGGIYGPWKVLVFQLTDFANFLGPSSYIPKEVGCHWLYLNKVPYSRPIRRPGTETVPAWVRCIPQTEPLWPKWQVMERISSHHGTMWMSWEEGEMIPRRGFSDRGCPRVPTGVLHISTFPWGSLRTELFRIVCDKENFLYLCFVLRWSVIRMWLVSTVWRQQSLRAIEVAWRCSGRDYQRRWLKRWDKLMLLVGGDSSNFPCVDPLSDDLAQ